MKTTIKAVFITLMVAFLVSLIRNFDNSLSDSTFTGRDTLLILDTNTVQLLTRNLVTEKELRTLAEEELSNTRIALQGKDRALIKAQILIRDLYLQLDSQYVEGVDTVRGILKFSEKSLNAKDYRISVQNTLYAPRLVLDVKDSLKLDSDISFICDSIPVTILLSELPNRQWSTIVNVDHSLFKGFSSVSTTVARYDPTFFDKLNVGVTVGTYGGILLGVNAQYENKQLVIISGSQGMGGMIGYSMKVSNFGKLVRWLPLIP